MVTMNNEREQLIAELKGNEFLPRYSGSGKLADFLSFRQRRRYHESDYKELASTQINIREFDSNNFHLFSVEALGQPYFGQRLLNLLTLARPRENGEEVRQTRSEGIIADWVIPDDQSEENQRLLKLHQRLKQKWDGFIWGDRYQFMKSLIYPETKVRDYPGIEPTLKERGGNPLMKPHLLWATSKNDGSRYYLTSENLPESLDERPDSGLNRRLGLVLATAVSPLQRDTIPSKIALRKGGFEQQMREAQVPLLVDMFESVVLRSDLFSKIEKSTGIVSSTLLKPPTLAQLLRGEVEDSMYLLNRFKREKLPIIAGAACTLGFNLGVFLAIVGSIDGDRYPLN